MISTISWDLGLATQGSSKLHVILSARTKVGILDNWFVNICVGTEKYKKISSKTSWPWIWTFNFVCKKFYYIKIISQHSCWVQKYKI